MIPFPLFVVLRLAVTGFFLLTAAYAVLNCSPFAFDMFIKPRLFPWLASFVAWHHLWYFAAAVAAAVTLLPELDPRPRRRGREKAAHWLAILFCALSAVVALRLIASPYLPTLWNDSRALPTAVAALLPLLALAAIDHLSAWRRLEHRTIALGPRRLLAACAMAAGFLWATHLGRALLQSDLRASAGVWVLSAVRALSLVAMALAVIYAIFVVVASIAGRSRARRLVEHALVGVFVSAGICEFLRRAVLPSISVSPGDAWIVAAAIGVTVTAVWSGLALRRPVAESDERFSAHDLFFAPALRPGVAALTLLAIPAASFAALGSMERLDWVFGARRTILLCELILTFGLTLRITRDMAGGTWSTRAIVVPPVAALAFFLAVPTVAAWAARATGSRDLEPSFAFQRHAGAEAGFKVLAETLVARPAFDPEYHRLLLDHAQVTGRARIEVPDVTFAADRSSAAKRRPDIFVFVIDSLRRDYLSVYNRAVTFTPNIEAFGAGSFVFQNAFTRHGGTELAIPSIWAGAAVVRTARARNFERINAIEKLVNADGYRLAINDFTVADHLRPSTPVVPIDEGIPSVETDLCRNLQSLQSYLDSSAGDSRPVFGYLAPMNVHILNTRRAGQRSLDGDRYPGFYAPYASRLKRIDACFGQFVSHLKAKGRYDDSIIVLTSDHGDSLGEDGYWGHATWLFPEDVRLPLIVHVPDSLRPGLTTDLARLTFSTDIAPTLYALLDYPVRDLGPLFGSPLFVPADGVLEDRRRQSFLLTASYGATYGLLRRNGRLLYVSDLVEWQELAYDLSRGQNGVAIEIDAESRRLNQRLIKERVAELSSFYSASR